MGLLWKILVPKVQIWGYMVTPWSRKMQNVQLVIFTNLLYYFKVHIFKSSEHNQISYQLIALQESSRNPRWPPISILGLLTFSVLDILKKSLEDSCNPHCSLLSFYSLFLHVNFETVCLWHFQNGTSQLIISKYRTGDGTVKHLI